MAHATSRESVATSVTAARAAADWVGPIPYALSIALGVVTLAAVVAALPVRDALRGPAVSVGKMQGTALVLLVVTLPVSLPRWCSWPAVSRWPWCSGSVPWLDRLPERCCSCSGSVQRLLLPVVAMLSLSIGRSSP